MTAVTSDVLLAKLASIDRCLERIVEQHLVDFEEFGDAVRRVAAA